MFRSILLKLAIKDCDIDLVSTLPDRPNIFLNFKPSCSCVYEKLDFYLQEVSVKGVKARKAILFCQTIKSVSDIFQHIMFTLGSKAFHLGLRKKGNNLVSMFHSCVSSGEKDYLLQTFVSPDSHIRFIITTIAFGMGVDVPDISFVFHWGASKSVLAYWQEVGRSGRKGEPAEAIFLPFGRSVDARRIRPDMVDFFQMLKVRLLFMS